MIRMQRIGGARVGEEDSSLLDFSEKAGLK